MGSPNEDNFGHYVVSAHKPTVVTHSVVGRFTGTDDLNLIIAYACWQNSHQRDIATYAAHAEAFTFNRKTSRIEIYRLTAEGLQAKLPAGNLAPNFCCFAALAA